MRASCSSAPYAHDRGDIFEVIVRRHGEEGGLQAAHTPAGRCRRRRLHPRIDTKVMIGSLKASADRRRRSGLDAGYAALALMMVK